MKLTENELRIAACEMVFIESVNDAFDRMYQGRPSIGWSDVKNVSLETFMREYARRGLRVCWNSDFKYDSIGRPEFEDIPNLLSYIADRDAPQAVCKK